MDKRILYPLENNGVAVIVPTGEIPVSEVARKDVPDGIPYLIVDVTEVPSDREFRNAWEADFSNPDGFGIGADAWFAEQESKEVSE